MRTVRRIERTSLPPEIEKVFSEQLGKQDFSGCIELSSRFGGWRFEDGHFYRVISWPREEWFAKTTQERQ